MQAQAYEGYIENGRFYPIDKIERIDGRRRAFVTVLDETVPNSGNQEFSIEHEQMQKNDKKVRAEWLSKLNAQSNLSLDEEVPFISRSIQMRKPIDLSD